MYVVSKAEKRKWDAEQRRMDRDPEFKRRVIARTHAEIDRQPPSKVKKQ